MFVIILLLLAIGAIFYLANDPSAIRKIKEYGGTPGPNDTNSSSAIPGVATAVPPNSTSLKKSPKKSDVKTPAATSSIRTAVSNVDSTRTAVSIRSKRVKKVGPVLGSASTQELKRDVEDLAASTPVGNADNNTKPSINLQPPPNLLQTKGAGEINVDDLQKTQVARHHAKQKTSS